MSRKPSLNYVLETTLHEEKIKGIDIINTEIFDVWCRLEEVQGVITVWRDASISDKLTCTMMGSIMTLLDSVEEAIKKVEKKLITYEEATHIIRK
ncbi:hypothetical protein SC171_05460 [Pantoea cypripedii]|uniref:hypothetical protein n=1 Tax=Pantoea cypripedii TaxID=55209 RepID=UPI002FC85D3C